MYKKINITLNALFVIALVYLMYKYTQAQNIYLPAIEKAKVLNNAADTFITIGFIICLLSLLWTNMLALKTKQLLWFWLTFLFGVFVSWNMSLQIFFFLINKMACGKVVFH